MKLSFRSLFYMILFLTILIIGVAVTFQWSRFLETPLTTQQQIIFQVSPGSSVSSIAKNLYSIGILSHPRLFVLLAHLRGNSHHIKAGEYEIIPTTTPPALLEKIVKGKVYLRHFTIVEGWTLKQVLIALSASPFLTHTLQYPDTAIATKIGFTHTNLEGYLYPDTYRFAAGIPDVTIFKQALTSMQHNLTKLWPKKTANLPYKDPYSALIVASLIEKETARPEERAKIAGVIVRRLQKKNVVTN